MATYRVRLDQVLVEPGDRLLYAYDFGDGWDHTIRLEAVAPGADDSPQVRCVGGRRACPPEDCGGIWGYHELLAGLADPDSLDEDQRKRLEWLDDGFEPADFDVQETDALVQQLTTGSGTAGWFDRG